ncbi:MAG: hypothetical protein ACKOW9_05180 [Candidatus Paceibacterota bacterium]
MKKSLLLTFLLTTLLFLMLVQLSSKNTSATEYIRQIKDCTNKVELSKPTQNELEESAISCVSLVLEEVIRNKKVEGILPYLKEMNMRPGFARICHISSHKAAINAFDSSRSLYDQHDQVNTITCDSGMYHGFWEAVGYSKPSLDTWRELIQWCEEKSKTLLDAGNCGDAAGHAAFDATKEQHSAVRLACFLFSADILRSECAEGVLMQRFIPGSGSPGTDPLPTLTNMPKLCEKLRYEEASIAKGCFRGIGWLLGQTAKTESQNLIFQSLSEGEAVCRALESGYNDCTDRYYETLKTRTFIQYILPLEGCASFKIKGLNERAYANCIEYVTFSNMNISDKART